MNEYDLMIKAIRVINSCENKHQLKIAKKYAMLMTKKISDFDMNVRIHAILARKHVKINLSS